jgi:AcrR family transcriptional regulator
MRITTEAKLATRKRILKITAELLRSKGFEATTIRSIARRAKIASGTLFNYFATKEAIVIELVAVELQRARTKFQNQRPLPRSFDEALFGLIAIELRHLRPYRACIAPLQQTVSSSSKEKPDDSSEQLQQVHLEMVAELAHKFKLGELSPVARQLYWTLYIGVLSFWANDSSPRLEDTFALIDQSLAMYVAWLAGEVN